MHAIDTNLIVRYLTGDHPSQAAKARTFIDENDVFVSITVLLETEWVLRSVYDYAPLLLIRALRAFAGLPNVTIEDARIAAQALDTAEAGLEFADALQLAKSEGCDALVTFDTKFARAANKLGTIKVRAL